MQMIIVGERPQKMGGFGHRQHKFLKHLIVQEVEKQEPELIYTGMALGVDQWGAAVAIELGIPFIAALPYKFQDLKWDGKTRQTYQRLLKRAIRIVYVDRELGYISTAVPPDVYEPAKMMARYNWMVDQLVPGDAIYGIWGEYAQGASRGVSNYATSKFGGDVTQLRTCPELFIPELRSEDIPF